MPDSGVGPDQRPQLAVVAYPAGRIGSSALMGLLKAGGLNVGRSARLNRPSPMNPKGFFELRSQQEFLCDAFRDFYPAITAPPAIERADTIGFAQYQRYGLLLQTEFADGFPAAVKSQRCLTLSLLDRLRDRYDIRVLRMDRREADQVRSMLRVWRSLPDVDVVRGRADSEFVRAWLGHWRAFAESALTRYPFPTLAVSFETLIAEPVATSSAIFRFLNVEPPAEGAVRSWIDVSLVNREAV